MKVLLLHISDLHFEKGEDISEIHIQKIVEALRGLDSFSDVIIIVSGDVAFAGKKEQYNVSYSFFTKLEKELQDSFNIRELKWCIVPGNHDIDFKKENLSNNQLASIFREKKMEENLKKEYVKMNAFYNHANGMGCFTKKNTSIDIQMFNLANKTIRINMINTALFSSTEEDQGFHYMSKKDLKELSNSKQCDYVITVMHHPHHWFHDSMKKELEKQLYKNTDLLFVGHEHYSSSLNVNLANYRTRIVAGGELTNRGEWGNSEFNAGVLDIDSGFCAINNYRWDSKNKIYVSSKSEELILKHNMNNPYDLVPNNKYMDKFLADQKYKIKPRFLDYYVFPRLERDYSENDTKQEEIIDINSFIEIVNKEKKIIVQGMKGSGKTLLLKAVFSELINNRIVIYLNGRDITDDCDQTIKISFEKIYSKDTLEYEKFKQIPKKDRILIIDNVEEIDENRFNVFIKEAETKFDTLIYSVGRIIELDIRERIKSSLLENKYTKYKISSFYPDKRKELVTKVVQAMNIEEKSQNNTINALCDVLKREKSHFKSSPDFIVQFTKYYCNHFGEEVHNSGEIFSIVFESNIVSLIKPYSSRMSVDKIMIILDKISYYAHCNKKYPLMQEDIMQIIKEYNEEYDSEVEYQDFVNTLTKAGIMYVDKAKYYFTDKNYLAYFVAREIKRKCLEEGEYSEFEKALDFACYGINSQIVLFVTYITDNTNLIKMIMDKADSITNEWDEFTINPIGIPFLSNVDPQKIPRVTERDKEKYEKKEVERERKDDRIRYSDQGDSFYEYDEKQSLSLTKRMVRSISLLVVIARTLPSFEHMMKKEDKEKCVRLIYEMPLRIFNAWAYEVERLKEELINELKEFDQGEYSDSVNQLTDGDIIEFIREESVILLLNLMNIGIDNATRKDTVRYLNDFNYEKSDLYKMEHLMILDKQDNVSSFIKQAIPLYENQKQRIAQYMVKSIVRHFMLTSKKIKRANIQKLNNKIWNGKINYTKILIRKKHNEKKEK